jgi:phenylacetate-CoA ligase
MPQVGILELIDEKGKRVTKEGARGEMVVTGFNNDIMPLIRYRTQDMAVLTKKKCSCGRNYQMIKKVEGRTQDYIIDKEGSIVPLAPAIFNYNDMDWTGVNEFKIEQKEKGILIIKVLLHPNSRKDKKKIQEQLIKKIPPIFGSGFSVSIRFVASIKYSAIGKHRYLDQKLILPTYAN